MAYLSPGGTEVAQAGTGTSTDNRLSLTVTANPTTLPVGGGSVTYTYTVKNNHTGAMYYSAFQDSGCSPVTHVSGLRSSYGYSYIPTGGSATFSCSTTVTTTITSSATATFSSDSGAVSSVSAPTTVTVAQGAFSCDTLFYGATNNAQGSLPATLGDLSLGGTPTPRMTFDASNGTAAVAMNPREPGYLYYVPRTGMSGSAAAPVMRLNLATGVASTYIPGGNNQAVNTARLAFSPDGTLWSYDNSGRLSHWDGTKWVSHGTPTSNATSSVVVGNLASGDIVFDGLGNMWVIASDGTNNYLFTVSSTELTKTSGITFNYVGSMGSGSTMNGLAFTTDGTLYATSILSGGSASQLYTVNKATGSTTAVGPRIANSYGLMADLASCALPKPELRVTKTAGPAGPVVAGDVITYTITVENLGALAATGVTFQDAIPANTTYVAGSAKLNGTAIGTAYPYASATAINSPGAQMGMVEAQAKATITFQVRVANPVPAGVTQIANQGTVKFIGGDPAGIPTDDSTQPGGTDPSVSPILRPGIAVEKTAPVTVQDGSGPITYSYDVTAGSGNEPLKSVTVADDRCPKVVGTMNGTYNVGDKNSDGLLDPGETWKYTCTTTLTSTTTNTATATGVGNRDNITVTSTDKWTVAVNQPNVNIVKSGGAVSGPDANGTYKVSYSVVVTNTGAGTGSYSNLVDTPGFASNLTPSGITWSGQATGSATGAGPYTLVAGSTSIAPGATHTYSVTMTFRYTNATQAPACAGAGTGLYNSVSATGEQGSTSDNAACVTPPSPPKTGLTLDKQVKQVNDVNNNGVTDPGDTIVYSFVVQNTGEVTLAPVVINDSKLGLSGWQCLTSLAPGASGTCTATRTYAITPADVNAGKVDNSATAVGTAPNTTVTSSPDTTSTPVASAPYLTITKSVSSVATTTNAQNGRFLVTYSVTVTNTGQTPTTFGALTDTASPASNLSVSSVEWSGATSGTQTGGGTFTLAPAGSVINGGETKTWNVVLRYQYLNNLPVSTCSGPGTGTYNSVSLPPGQESGPTTDNAACADAPPPLVNGMTMTKTAGTIVDVDNSRSATAGDTITYTFRVTNTGSSELKNVAVSDPKVGTITCSPTTLAPGASVTCTAAPYTLTQTDIDSGSVNNTATATATPPVGTIPPVGSSTTTPIPSGPAIDLVKTATVTDVNGNGRTDLGDTIRYTFVVTNTGNTTLGNIKLTDPKVTGLSCPATTLAPLASTTCTAATYTITAADVAAGVRDNTASVTGTDPKGTAVTDTASTSTPVVNPSISLVKSVASIQQGADGRTNTGDTVNYKFVVTNTGNTTLTGVTVTDPKVSNISCPSTSLTAGASMTCTGSYLVTSTDTGAGSITNTATASGNPPTGTPVTSTSTVVTPTYNPSITIDKQHAAPVDTNGNGRVDAGDTVVYSFVVRNTGNTTLSTVAITDPKLTSTGVTITCPATTLAVGDSTTCTSSAYTITAADAQTGAVNNTAEVSAQPLDSAGGKLGTTVSASDNDTVTVQRASVTLDKAHTTPEDVNGNGRVDAGDRIKYTFLVTNTGNVALDSISIDDAKVGTVSCPATSLAAGASTTCTATYTITAADAQAGKVDNTATVTGTPPTGTPVTATDTDTQTAIAPAVSFDKIQDQATGWTDVDGNGRINAGDTLVYSFSVGNTGNTALSGIAITDDKLGAVSCPSTTLAIGKTMTCTAAPYTVTSADEGAGSVINHASVTAQPPTGTPLTATDSTVTPVETAGIDIVKRHNAPVDTNGNGRVDAGDTITYFFDLTNTGNTTLTEVTVTDNKVGTISCPKATLAPGEKTTCTITEPYEVKGVTGGTQLVNEASVTGQPIHPGGAPAGSKVADTDTNTVEVFNAAIDLEKKVASIDDNNVNGRHDAGDVIHYTFDVTNTGSVPLASVTVDDTKVTGLSCPQTRLEPQGTMQCTAAYTISAADVSAGTVPNTATANGQPLNSAGDPAGSQVTDTSQTITPVASAGITLDKKDVSVDDLNGNGRNDVGDRIHYEFVITNTGTLTLTNVTLADPKITDGSCPSTTLAPGDSMTCTGSKPISETSSLQGQAKNTATASGQPVNPDGTRGGDPVSIQDTNTVPTLDARITLVKSTTQVRDLDNNGRTNAGDTITYQFVVTNTGNTTLSNITISDTMITQAGGRIICPATSLPAGVSTTCTSTPYVVTAADEDTVSVDNTATTTGQPVDATGQPVGDPVTATDTETQQLVGAKLSLSKTIASINDVNKDGRTDPGDTITYRFTVSNDGASQLTDVTVTDPMFGGTVCGPLTLAPGTASSCTKTHTVTTADTEDGLVLTNTATATGTPPEGTLDEVTSTAVTPVSNASITVVKSTDDSKYEDLNGNGRKDVGDHLWFQFEVTNTGNLTVTNVSVIDSKIGGAVSCPVTTLDPGESTTCVATQPKTITQASADLGTVTNTATAHGQPVNSDGTPAGEILTATDTHETTTQSASISLDKSVREVMDDNRSGRPDEGDTVVYDLTMTNTGKTPLGQVTLTEPNLPLNALADIRCTSAFTREDTVATLDAPLDPGASVTCTVSVVLTPQIMTLLKDKGYLLKNTATTEGQPLNPDGSNAGTPVTSTDTATLQVYAPALELTKTVDSQTDVNKNGRRDAGDTVQYTFTVTNSGNTPLHTVRVSDPRLSGVSCTKSELAAGESMKCTSLLSYVITAEDAKQTELENTATATGVPIVDGVATQPITSNEATATVPLQSASITITKDATLTDSNGTGRHDQGDTAQWTFKVTNTGTTTLNQITLTDADPEARPITCVDPDGGAQVSNGSLSLQPGATATCLMEPITISAADAKDGLLINHVDVTGTPTQGTPVTSFADHTAPLQDAHVAFTKAISGTDDLNGNGRVDTGDVIRYTFTVTNTGLMRLDDIKIADPNAAGLTCGAETLAPGASMECTATHVVTATEAASGNVHNEATVTAQPVDESGTPAGKPLEETDTADQPTQLAGMSLDKTASTPVDANANGRQDVGDTVTYTFTVTNTGSVPLSNVSITDDKLGLTNYPCVATIRAKGTGSCTATYTLTQPDLNAGTVRNAASATAVPPTGTPLTDDDTADVPLKGTPSLTLDKSAGQLVDTNGNGRQDAGDTITYQFTVTNNGSVVLTKVAVDDPKLGVSDLVCAQSLEPGESVTCTAPAYTVTQADADAGAVVNTATATGDSPAGPTPPVNDTTTTTIQPATALRLVKTAGALVDANGNGKQDVGDTIAYTFTVTNDSSVSLARVVINDAKLGLVNHVCTAGPLAPGRSATCTAPTPYALTQPDLDAGTVDNTATATGTLLGDSSTVTSIESSTSTPLAPASGIDLKKTAGALTDANGNGKQDAGDTVVYTFVVKNTGATTLNNITLQDPKLGLSSFECGTVQLAPGEQTTCTSPAYAMTQADANAGAIHNEATASGIPTVGDRVTDKDTADVPVAPTPAISLEKIAGKLTDSNLDGRQNAGDTITYTFRVTNTGNVTLTGIKVTDPKVGDVVCLPRPLEPGKSMTCTAAPYVLTVDDVDAETVDNSATATGTPPTGTPPTATDTTSTPIEPTSGIDLVKTAGAATTAKGALPSATDDGDTITYTFTVTNTGDTTLRAIAITDPKLGAVTCKETTLAPGAQTTCTAAPYVIKVQDLDSGLVENTASVTATNPEGHEVTDKSSTTTEITPVESLQLVKVADVTRVTEVGQVVNYTFTLVNNGNVTLTNVVLSDEMLSLDGVTCGAARLAPGKSTTCTHPYRVTQADLDQGTLDNLATAAGTTPDGHQATAEDIEHVDVAVENSITLDKTASTPVDLDGNGVDAGDTVTYTFRITNAGSRTLREVTLTDPKLSLWGRPCGGPGPITLAPGASTTCTVDYTLTQDDLNERNVLNRATATGTDPQGAQVTSADEATTPLPTSDQLVLTKQVSDLAPGGNADGIADIDEKLSYTFRVTNAGTSTLTHIVVKDRFTRGGDGPLTDIRCPQTFLLPGDSMVCTMGYTVIQSDLDVVSIDNTAVAIATPVGGAGEISSGETAATIPTSPHFGAELDKKADVTFVSTVGQKINYTFTVTNTGLMTLADVRINDAKLGIVDALCADRIAPGEKVTCPVTGSYTVTQADLDAGSVPNTASAKIDLLTDDSFTVTDTEVVPVTPVPDLQLEKSAAVTDVDGNGINNAGDTVVYTFTLTNNGNTTLTSPVVVDPMLDAANIAVTCPTTRIQPGASVACTSAPYTINAVDQGNGQVVNTAVVNAKDPQGAVVTSNEDGTTTLLPAIQLDKVATLVDTNGDGLASAGETINYTFRVTNVGGTALTNVTLTDSMLGMDGATCAATLAAGQSTTCLATSHVVTQADVDAGSILNTASVAGSVPGGGTVTSTDGTVTPTYQLPTLDLVKRAGQPLDANADGIVDAGDQIVYYFDVTNTGTVSVSSLAVDDPMLAKAGVAVKCPVTSLAPGEKTTCVSDAYTITMADQDLAQVKNVATVEGKTPTGTVTSPPADTTTRVATPKPGLSLLKEASLGDTNGNGLADLGETLSYTFTVTNTGNTVLNQVTVSDKMLGMADRSCVPTLAPGETTTCAIEIGHVVTLADVTVGSIVNTATAGATQPGLPGEPGTPVASNVSSTTTPAQQAASLVLAKNVASVDDTSGENGIVDAGDKVVYEFTVSNQGTTPVSDITIDDPLLRDAGVNITCQATSLQPGETTTCTSSPYTIQLTDVSNGGVVNVAIAKGEGPAGPTQSEPDTVTVPVTRVTPALTLTKTVADASGNNLAEVGETLTYTFEVRNDGNVVVNDLKVADAFTIAGKGVPSQISCQATSLAPGESTTCTMTYTVVEADLAEGQLFNVASATGTTPGGVHVKSNDETANIPTPANTPKIALAKEVASVDDNNGDKLTNVGDLVNYTFTVTNTRNVSLTGIVVNDPKIGAVDCEATTLAVGASTTCTGSYTVTEADETALEVVNTATVTGKDPSGKDVPSEPATATVKVTPALKALQLVKTVSDADGDGLAQSGEVLTYTFTVTNSGNVAVSGLTIKDRFLEAGSGDLSDIVCKQTDLAIGETTTCTATYKVTDADVALPRIINAAKAEGTTPRGPVASPETSATIITPPTNPALAMVKNSELQDTNGDGYASAGEKISYTFDLVNTGNQALTDVTVVDAMLRTIGTTPTCTATTLAIGERMRCTAEYTVTAADIQAGAIVNEATATAKDPDGKEVSAPPSTTRVPTTPTLGAPGLKLAKTAELVDLDGDGVGDAGEQITWSFVLTNTGEVTLTDLGVDDPMLAAARIDIVCPEVVLPPGASVTCVSGHYTITDQDEAAGRIVNTATATGNGSGRPVVSNESTVDVPTAQPPSPSTPVSSPPVSSPPVSSPPVSSPPVSSPPVSSPSVSSPPFVKPPKLPRTGGGDTGWLGLALLAAAVALVVRRRR